MKSHALQTKSEQTAELIVGCQGLVRSIAWKIHRQLPPHVDLDDLVGYGQIGLAEAARDYDIKHKTQFTTYAYYRIRGAILDGLSRLAWFNRGDYLQGRYEHFAHEVLKPDADLQGDGSSTCKNQVRDDVRWFKRATGTLAVVCLMSQVSASNGKAIEPASAEESPQSSAANVELCEKLRGLVHQLPSDARALIQGAYFEGLSLKEAGERIGISKAWASRLHARTLQQLAKKLVPEKD